MNSSIKYLNFNTMNKEITIEGKKCRILPYWKYKNSNGLMFSMNEKGQLFFGVNIQRKFFLINHDKLETKALMYQYNDNLYIEFVNESHKNYDDAFKITKAGSIYSIKQNNPIIEKYINIGITKFILVPSDITSNIFKVETFSPSNKNHM